MYYACYMHVNRTYLYDDDVFHSQVLIKSEENNEIKKLRIVVYLGPTVLSIVM